MQLLRNGGFSDEKVMYMIRVLNYSPTKENYMRSNLELKVPYVFNSAEQSHEWDSHWPDLEVYRSLYDKLILKLTNCQRFVRVIYGYKT